MKAQFASLRMELLQLVADRIEEVTRPLRDEAAAIKLWLARAVGSWERAEEAATCGVGRAPVGASDARLRDAGLLEFFGPFSPVRRPCDSSPLGFDVFRLPLEGCSDLAPLLPDAVDDKVASPKCLQSLIPDDVEGFGLAEFFVEASSVESSRLEASAFEHHDVVDVLAAPLVPFVADPEVADSTKLCDFLANLASKKRALMPPLCESLEENPAASVVVSETMPAEDIQVDPGDPAADKLNAFLSSVFSTSASAYPCFAAL